MNEIIDLNSILEEFINPPEPKSFIQKFKSKEVKKQELTDKIDRGHWIKEGLRTRFWQEILRPNIIKSLKRGMGTLLRPSSLSLSETEIKQILTDMQVNISVINEMRYALNESDTASETLAKMEKR